MKNLSISILNVEDVPNFLKKLKEIEAKLQKRKIDNLLDVTIHFDVMDNKFVPNTGIDIGHSLNGRKTNRGWLYR